MDAIARIRKAIMAGLSSGTLVLVGDVHDHGSLSESDAIIIVGTVIVVGFLTWLVPNAPPAPAPLPVKS